MGYPKKAALFGFALAIVAYNLLVVTRGTLASGLGEELEELGDAVELHHHMATRVAATTTGMLVAQPCRRRCGSNSWK